MPIIPIKCPNCGADLQADSDNSILNCQYCGSSSVLKDAIVHNYIQNTINITAETVNVIGQREFVIVAGVLKKYQGEAIDVVIPENVSTIGSHAFDGLRIKSVVIPNGVTEIGECAFRDCFSLSTIALPSSVTVINQNAFRNCISLVSITFPENMVIIGDRAFCDCTSLSEVIAPNSYTDRAGNAFAGTPFEYDLKRRGFEWHRDQEQCKFDALVRERMVKGKCRNCGGDFRGFRSKVCSKCGMPKDY